MNNILFVKFNVMAAINELVSFCKNYVKSIRIVISIPAKYFYKELKIEKMQLPDFSEIYLLIELIKNHKNYILKE